MVIVEYVTESEGIEQSNSGRGRVLERFYKEAMMWMCVTVSRPRKPKTNDQTSSQRLCISLEFLWQHVTKITISHAELFQRGISSDCSTFLCPVNRHRWLSPNMAAVLGIQSFMFTINLAPRQLLPRFPDIVRNAMIFMIQQHNAQVIDQPRWWLYFLPHPIKISVAARYQHYKTLLLTNQFLSLSYFRVFFSLFLFHLFIFFFFRGSLTRLS